MTRDEFLQKLFRMYPNTFKKENITDWTMAYEEILKPHFDYNNIFNFMVLNYNHTNIAPSPSFFKDIVAQEKPYNAFA